ncbi:DNA-binding protein [Moraxella oculi]|uniref:DNA-binding protein n=1 Tax=Moraxella oculi TaxID=2940516 RepID=A0ABW8UC14_9GAMM
MAITVEQIHRVADELTQQGESVTQMSVRNRLGGGSFTTIGEALKTWRAEQDNNAQLAKIVIPAEIEERAELLVAQLWDIAQSLANDRLQKDREALAHKEALMSAEINEYQGIIETLESEQTELLAQLDKLTAVVDELRGKLAHCEQMTASKDNELALVKQELNTAQSKAVELADSLKKMTAKYDDKADKVERLTAELATATSQKTAVIDELDALKKTSQSDKAQLDNTIGELQAKLSQMTIDNATLTGRADTLQEQLDKAESTNQAQIAKIEQLTADIATLKSQNSNKAGTDTKTKSKAVKADKTEQE